MNYMNTNYYSKQRNLHLTFKNAQSLFCSYSTLQSNSILENNLTDILDTAILNTFDSLNKRFNSRFNIRLKHVVTKYYQIMFL